MYIRDLNLNIFLAGLSALLLILSYPEPDFGWLAWIALVPLCVAFIRSKLTASFNLGLLCSLITSTGVFYWIFEVNGFRFYHFAIFGIYISLYLGLWSLLLCIYNNSKIPVMIFAPCAWVSMEYLKTHAGFLSFPWASLAHTQHNNIPIIQLASIMGEQGISFLIVMFNIAVSEYILKRRIKGLILTSILIGLAYLSWYLPVFNENPPKYLKVAIVQPNISKEERRTIKGLESSYKRLKDLTISAAMKNPGLIIWPETALKEPTVNQKIINEIDEFVKQVNIPILTGASEINRFYTPDNRPESFVSQRSYNSAYLYIPGKETGDPYRKKILVPFGEYIPCESILPTPPWLDANFLPVIPGEKNVEFYIANNACFSVLICWENLFSDFTRKAISPNSNFLVNITNDNWFGLTAEPLQHNIASVFRAVENRIPVVLASNNGPSQIIDSYGRVIQKIPGIFTNGILVAEMPLNSSKSIYRCFGYGFSYLCILICLYSLILTIIKKGRNRSNEA